MEANHRDRTATTMEMIAELSSAWATGATGSEKSAWKELRLKLDGSQCQLSELISWFVISASRTSR
jgi:hypothetical protein